MSFYFGTYRARSSARCFGSPGIKGTSKYGTFLRRRGTLACMPHVSVLNAPGFGTVVLDRGSVAQLGARGWYPVQDEFTVRHRWLPRTSKHERKVNIRCSTQSLHHGEPAVSTTLSITGLFIDDVCSRLRVYTAEISPYFLDGSYVGRGSAHATVQLLLETPSRAAKNPPDVCLKMVSVRASCPWRRRST